MKKIIIVLFLSLCGYKGWERFQQYSYAAAAFETPYIAIYGRDSCGYTQRALKKAKAEGVKFHYLKVDDRKVADSLHEHMRASGISTRRYNLPVVDVNGKISVRPDMEDVLLDYSKNF